MSRLDDLQRFYSLLSALEERLAGARRLTNCSGRMSWPKRGVYFFMEPGETRSHSGRGFRIVRIGTHALKPGSQATLWKRLSQHRGVARTGGGNHRGSIFRLIVGTALIGRDAIDCDSWDDRRGSASREVREREQPLERAVSEVIRNMPFSGFPSRMSRVRKACADLSSETRSRFSATMAGCPSIRRLTHGSAAIAHGKRYEHRAFGTRTM